MDSDLTSVLRFEWGRPVHIKYWIFRACISRTKIKKNRLSVRRPWPHRGRWRNDNVPSGETARATTPDRGNRAKNENLYGPNPTPNSPSVPGENADNNYVTGGLARVHRRGFNEFYRSGRWYTCSVVLFAFRFESIQLNNAQHGGANTYKTEPR